MSNCHKHETLSVYWLVSIVMEPDLSVKVFSHQSSWTQFSWSGYFMHIGKWRRSLSLSEPFPIWTRPCLPPLPPFRGFKPCTNFYLLLFEWSRRRTVLEPCVGPIVSKNLFQSASDIPNYSYLHPNFISDWSCCKCNQLVVKTIPLATTADANKPTDNFIFTFCYWVFQLW